ncbi:MAG: GH32 C-terminal domain-containing protein [Tetrasphaera jenkinsii]|nr:GH32 C-terminal domain-containing protein [Tetrasphaera jenkinsii]
MWDKAGGGWGHLTLDHVVMGDVAATVRSDETAVNLVMDGQVVASATGANSEYLDWQAFDLRPYAGKTAHIEIVDNNRFGWGHILADEFRFGDAPAPSRAESYDWLDYGRDYYAAVSWNTGKLYVDRTHSGKVDFHPAFSSVEDARVAMVDGKLTLSIYLDRSSVEVFAQGGTTTITDQVFPSADSDRIGLFAEGGTAQLEKLTVTPLAPSMFVSR